MNKRQGFDFRTNYDFRPDVLDIIISGKSSIDSTEGFQVHDLDEAKRFIHSYGYDLDDPIEKSEVLGNFHEALNFIRKTFLQPENPDGLRLEVPRKILELTDMRELFLMVNMNYPGQTTDSAGKSLQNWACSLLKVMHTVSHLDKDIRTSYFTDIQKQIFDRFYKLVYRDPEGQLFLASGAQDQASVPLVSFETKPKKSRHSMILKLLHKPENVAEDIFDRVGIRFTTHTPLDALRVVKYLKDNMIVMPPNIKPSRSRNTLVQVENFKNKLAGLMAKSEKSKITEQDFRSELDQAANPPGANPDNPHSSEFYRAIQFTCRQLIKLRNPIYDDLKEIKAQARIKQIDEALLRVVDRLDMKHILRDIRFFYPFEVQVVDKKSAEDNERGRSAHSEYRKAQVTTALKRVMGNLADALR